MKLTERLRGYNPPDRTTDEQRQIAIDIHAAVARIERLEAALRGLIEDVTNIEHEPHDWSEQVCIKEARAALAEEGE